MLRFLVLFALVGLCICDRKRWTGNTNWENVNNWDQNDLPCSADRVLFQEYDSTPFSVFVGNDVVVSEIVFPLDGSLILDDGVSIAFSNDSDCDRGTPRAGMDAQFVGGERKDWFNPSYWQTLSQISSHELDVDLPLNKLPCENDDVVFPDGATFSVSIDREVVVKTFEYQGTLYHDGSLQEFLQSVDGKHQFQFINKPDREASLTVSGQGCSDTAGCHCGNNLDNTDFIGQECRSYVVDTCRSPSQLDCSNPFTPPGACCQVCGSVVQVKIPRENQQTFNYLAFQQAVYGVLQIHNTTGAGITRIQISDGSGDLGYSIFFLTGPQSPSPTVTSTALKDLLTRSSSGGFGFPEKAVVIQMDNEAVDGGFVSGNVGAPLTNDNSDNTTLYIALGVVGGVVAILAVVVVILVIQRRSSKKSSDRANIDTASRVGDTLGVVSYTNMPSDARATLEGFDNPMYSERIKQNPVYDEARGPTVVNPVFLDDDGE